MRRMQPLSWIVTVIVLSAVYFAACGPPTNKPPLTPDGDNPELTSGGTDGGMGGGG